MGQQYYDHIAARGQAAMEKPYSKRTKQEKEDVKTYRNVFGDSGDYNRPNAPTRPPKREKTIGEK